MIKSRQTNRNYSKDRQINSMFTSVQNMARGKDDKYDAKFLYFCISKLSRINGQSKRFIMCKLLECGLKSCVEYSKHYDMLYDEYRKTECPETV